jgi:polysaccharide export outer membrane protein
MNIRFKLFLFIFSVSLFSSCVTNKKRVLFQSENAEQREFEYAIKLEPYRVQIGDVLYTSINSDPLNIPGTIIDPMVQFEREMLQGSQNPLIWGNLVDDNGNLDVRNIGLVKVVGLTISEIKEKIRQEAAKKYFNPTVKVFHLNFYVTVMGEVRNPGVHLVFMENPTLIDAISKSGDMLNFADRSKVEIIRFENNKVQRFILDLTNENTLKNSHLFIHPNDKIIVRPLKSRRFAPDNQGNALVSIASLVVSTLTTFTLFFLRAN